MNAPHHKETTARAMFERQALAFHYELCRRRGDPAFSPDRMIDKQYAPGRGVVYLASTGARIVALYAFEPTDIGYKFRRLTSELEGRQAGRAVSEASAGNAESLAALGLSLREIAAITRLERGELLRQLGAL